MRRNHWTPPSRTPQSGSVNGSRIVEDIDSEVEVENAMADSSASVVDTARAALGAVSTYLPIALTDTPPIDEQREAARNLERAGYRAAWTNETVGGKDALVQLSVLLAATDRMTFGTGIANIWSRPAQTAQAAAAQLAQAYPTRLVLGLGVGYPQQAESVGREFGSPVATMRDYLEKMSAPTVPPAAQQPFPRILAANRPKMLALAAELTDGALPVGLPATATTQVRQALGPDKLLVVGVSVFVDAPNTKPARERARESVAVSLSRPWFAQAVKRFGFTDQQIEDIDDTLVDAIVAHGTPEAIAATLHAHLAAGADHVVMLPQPATDLPTGVKTLTRLAPAVLA
jgi:probable F420-dependent oxidoreductase